MLFIGYFFIFQGFPCMDEPSLKATFQLSLVVPKNRVGLSNMVCPVTLW